jgi:signal transduction histidine kinase
MAPTMKSRLSRTVGLTAAVAVAVTALVTLALVRRYAGQVAIAELRAHGDAVALEAQNLELGQAQALRRLLVRSGERVAYVGPRGGIRADDAGARAVAQSIDVSKMLGGTPSSGTVRTPLGTFAYAAVPVSGARGATVGVVLARPVGLAGDVWTPVALRLLVGALAAAAIGVAIAGPIADRLVKPIRRVADATALVAAGDLAHRVPVEGEGEAADLARRFNAMAEGLGEARRREHEFLASVSHELRTPITSIRGYAEALADGAATGPRADEALAVIHAEANRLERLVQDVMDLARLGAKEFRLEPAAVDLADTLADAVRALAPRAAEAGVALSADAPAPLRTVTDSARVRQIVSNLVENALRVTPSGGTVGVSGAVEPGGALAIEVHDTGPGIAPEDLPHTFERSYLWTRSKAVREVGTGLGLAIVRELATALGGTLSVSSVAGRGSTFRLILPPR